MCRKVDRAAVTDHHRGVAVDEHHRHRLANDVTAAQHDCVASEDFDDPLRWSGGELTTEGDFQTRIFERAVDFSNFNPATK